MAGGADAARGWYAFDEGGDGGPGKWTKARTTWRPAVAMPHGSVIAEMHLLLRDCLPHEDGDNLVLLAGVPPEWFRKMVTVEGLPTAFGRCSFAWKGGPDGATISLTGDAAPPGGYVLRVPPELHARVADKRAHRKAGLARSWSPTEREKYAYAFE